MTNDNVIADKENEALEHNRSARLDVLSKHLIDSLQPRRPYYAAVTRFSISIAVCAVYLLLLNLFMPMRTSMINEDMFQVDIVLSWGIGVSALYAALALMVPCDTKDAIKRIILPSILAVVFLAWTFFRTYNDLAHEHNYMMMYSFKHCFWDGLIFIIAPMVLFIEFARRGASTAPTLLHVMVVLSVSGFGWGCLRFSCANDEPAHAFIFHFLPFVTLGGLSVFFSRFLFRSI